ncbi:g235 [Coccomyxa elongata]
MRILVWNINALMPTVPNFVLKYGSLKGFFDEYSADVICFQETKLQSEEKLTKETACVDGYESFWAFSREKKGYSGVATYVAERYSPIDAQVDCLGTGSADIDREGRVVLTDLGAFVLINVYVPNAGNRTGDGERTAFKVRFLEALKEKADALRAAGRQVIIVGDLNVAASQKDVHSKLKYDWMYSAEEKALLQSLLNDYTDAWRLQHPQEQSVFTVWDEKTSARAFNEGVRIDYALLTPELLQRLVSCEIISTLPPKWSDHAAVLLELADIPTLPKHPPCALSSRRIKRFQQPKTSVASLFAKKRAAQTAATALDGSAPCANDRTDTKKMRTVECASAMGNQAIADGVSAADAATPSSAFVETSMEMALKKVDRGPQAMEGAEEV